ncbi:MAG: rRNA adenine N-6-methyltransferase family protein, partial [Devosia sp.]
MRRRDFLAGSLTVATAAALPGFARANVPVAFDPSMNPPMNDRQAFIDWMVKNRGEDPKYLGLRFDRFRHMVANKDLLDDRNKKAFLFTPREEFVLKQNLDRVYDSAFLDINYGVTISGPHLVGRMTTAIDVQPTDKVLEIGTGSGYQSAYLSHLTDKVWTIEIIKPLAERTRGFYDALIGKGYTEFKSITSQNADG